MFWVNFIRQIRKKFSQHEPLVKILVLKNNLLSNLHAYQKKFPQLKIAPVLKSNAYGHGLVAVAKILDRENPPFFCVDSFFEARQLRHEGIKTKILIIGYVRPEEICASRLKDVSFTIVSLEQLQQISTNFHKFLNIHLKIDTGMHRQGIALKEIEAAIDLIKNNKNIFLEGVCSHLADADNKNQEFTLAQVQNWNRAAKIFQENFGGLKFLHLAATAGLAYADKINAQVARVGIGLYGFDISSLQDLDLKPVLEMRTILTSVKEILPGDKVGYGGTFVANQPMKIATVPVGYFEGVDRRLSNRGWLKVRNVFCPIIGCVSMNITSLDISQVNQPAAGDEVLVISSQPNDKNSVENLAKLCNTIPYEILVHLPFQLRREVI